MAIIEKGVQIAGGNPVIDTGLGRPLTWSGVPTDGVVGVASEGTMTIAEPVTDGDTFTVDGKVYTLQTALTDVDGNIAIGGSEAQTKLNIVAALNLTGVAGTDYALSMTLHPTVSAAAFVGDDSVFTAKTAGVAGDSIDTTETFTHVSNVFDAATLGTTTAGVDEVTGAYAGKIIAGGLVKDLDTQNVYENDGTQAVPTYTRIDTV